MTPRELFEALENTGNHYSFFRKGTKYVLFSTGGWSENEELVEKLEQTWAWRFSIIEWRTGGHYKFKIPSKQFMDYDYDTKEKRQ
jgi:hypothetical protein